MRVKVSFTGRVREFDQRARELMEPYLYDMDASMFSPENRCILASLKNPNELDDVGSGLKNHPIVGGVEIDRPRKGLLQRLFDW